MKNIRNAKKYVVEFLHRHPRQDLSREEIVAKVFTESSGRFKPVTVTRVLSEITECNKEGIVYCDIHRMANGKFKYVPKNATLTQFL